MPMSNTPPPAFSDELLMQWILDACGVTADYVTQQKIVATQAINWALAQRSAEPQAAADAELQACCQFIRDNEDSFSDINDVAALLYRTRRP